MSGLGLAGTPSSGGSLGGGTKITASVKAAGDGIAKILNDLRQVDSLLDRINRKGNTFAQLSAGAGGIGSSLGAAAAARAFGYPGGHGTSKGMPASLAPRGGTQGPAGYGAGGMQIHTMLPGGPGVQGPGMMSRLGGAAERGFNRYGAVAVTSALQSQYGKNMGAIDSDLLYNQFSTYGAGYSRNFQRNILGRQFTSASGGGFLNEEDRLAGFGTMRNAGMDVGTATMYAKGTSMFSRMTGSGFGAAAAIGTGLDTSQNSLRLRMFGIQTRDGRTGMAKDMNRVLDQMYSTSYRPGTTTENIKAGFVRGGSQYKTFSELGYSDEQIQNIAQMYMGKAKAGGAAIGSSEFKKANPGLGNSLMSSTMDKAKADQDLRDTTFSGRAAGIAAFNEGAKDLKVAANWLLKFTQTGAAAGFAGGFTGQAGGSSVMGGIAHDATLLALAGRGGGMGTLLRRGASRLPGLGRLAPAALEGETALLPASAGGLAALGPIGLAAAVAAAAHQGGSWMQKDASKRRGFIGGAEDFLGNHFKDAWKGPGANVLSDAKNLFKHFADGGVIPGNHNRDTVPIYATPGEVVVPKHIVQMHGGAHAVMSALGFSGKGGGSHYARGGEVSGWGSPGSNLTTAHAAGLSFTVNKQIASAMEGFVNALARRGYKPRTVQGFNNRNIAGSSQKSNHAYGAAIDIDPGMNPRYGAGGGKHAIPDWAGDLAKQFGLGWGGNYHDSKDYMHFEALNGPASRGSYSDGAGGSSGGGGSSHGGFWSRKFKGLWSRHAASGGGGGASTAPSNVSGNAALARKMASARGWGSGSQWDALYWLWNQESGFSHTAGDPKRAYGIPQALPGNKMASAGSDWLTNPATQIKWGLDYIAGRYHDPAGAVAHKHATRGQYGNKEGWYAKGAWRTKDEDAHLHEGEMVLPAGVASAVRAAMAGGSQIGGKAAPGHGGACKTVNLNVYPTKADAAEARKLAEMVKAILEQDDVMDKALRV